MARCHLAGLEIRGVHHEGVDGDRLAQQEPTIYLVPDCDGLNQAIEYLGENVAVIFQEHLDGWYGVPAVWPTFQLCGLSLAFTP